MIDSNGNQVDAAKFEAACQQAADDYVRRSYAIRAGDYASHVTEARKDQILKDRLAHAESIRSGHIDSFATWQRLNTIITGECVPFLPKVKHG